MKEENISKVISAGTELIKAIPVYQDLLQPATKELGKGLEKVAKSVHVALSPLSALLWGYDQISEWLSVAVARKLKDVPKENIQTPELHLVGPAVESLRFAAGNPTLREMYAQLIATSMDAEVAEKAHPSFVEIIKQLSPDEAKILQLFRANTIYPYITILGHAPDMGTREIMKHWSDVCIESDCDVPAYASVYLENLERLSIIEFNDGAEIEEEHYLKLEATDSIKELIADYKESQPELEMKIERGVVSRTMLGQVFLDACVGKASGIQAKPST